MFTLEAVVFCTLTGQICHSMFKIDSVYNRRRDIHAMYGGNWQSGICPSRSHPFISFFQEEKVIRMVILTSGLARIYMHTPERVKSEIWSLLGENLALLNHLESGNRIFFFEAVGKGWFSISQNWNCMTMITNKEKIERGMIGK